MAKPVVSGDVPPRTPVGQESGSAVGERWLVFRTPEGEQFGRIVDEGETSWTVEIADGKSVEVRRARGEGQQVVLEDSLEFRHRREPASLQENFVQNPADFVARLLVEFPKPKSKDELLQYLSRYDIHVDGAAWRKLQPRLRKHQRIALERDRYRSVGASDTRSGPGDVDELLLQALSAGATSDGKRRLAAAITQVSGSLDAARVVLVRAAGCLLPPPDWDQVHLEGLDDQLAEHLLDEAVVARAWSFLANVALNTKRSKVSTRAAHVLAESPDRNLILAEKIEGLTRDLSNPLDRHVATDYLDRRLDLVFRIIGSEADERLVAALLRFATVVRLGAARPAISEKLYMRIVVGVADACRSESVLASAIQRLKLGAPELDVVKGALVGLEVAASGRRRWLRAVAASGNDALLSNPGWWEGASLTDLTDLEGDDSLGPILIRHPEIGRAAVNRALRAKPPAIGAVLDLPPWLLQVADPEVLRSAVNRLDETHPLSVLIRREVDQRADAVHVEGELRVRALELAHRAEVEALRAELEHVGAELAAEQAHAVELALRLRQAIGAADTDNAARRRQVRLDALVAVAAIASEIERSLAGLVSRTLSPEETMMAILREAQSVGVVRDAAIGTTVELDRTKYQLINDDDSGNGPVVVVEPAYFTREGGEVTMLRLGKASLPVGPGAVEKGATRARSRKSDRRD